MANLKDTMVLGKLTVTDSIIANKFTQGNPSTDSSIINMNRFESDLFVSGNGVAPNAPTVPGFYLGRSTFDQNRHMDIVSGSDSAYIDFNKASVQQDFAVRLIANVSNGLTEFQWDSSMSQKTLNILGGLTVNNTSVVTNNGTNASAWNISINGNAATATSANSVAWSGVTDKTNATQKAAGLMSADDKKKLDGIADGANKYTYTLPTASSTTLGGVKTGYKTDGRNYKVDISDGHLYVNVPWTDNNTTYSAGTGLSLGGTGNTTFSVNFANSTLYKVGDDAWFGDQDVAGAFCIKGNNGNTSLRMIGYTGGVANLIYNSSDKCIDITFN